MRRCVVVAFAVLLAVTLHGSADASHHPSNNPCNLDGHRSHRPIEPIDDIVILWDTHPYVGHTSSGGTTNLSRYIEVDGEEGRAEAHLEVRVASVPQPNRVTQAKASADGQRCVAVAGQKLV